MLPRELLARNEIALHTICSLISGLLVVGLVVSSIAHWEAKRSLGDVGEAVHRAAQSTTSLREALLDAADSPTINQLRWQSPKVRSAFRDAIRELSNLERLVERKTPAISLAGNHTARLGDTSAAFLRARVTERSDLPEARRLISGALLAAEQSQVMVAQVQSQIHSHGEELASQNQVWTISILAAISLLSAFQFAGVFRPMMRKFLSHEAQLKLKNEEVESSLAEVVARTAELQEQQAVLTERLNDQGIVTEHLRLATSRLHQVLGSMPVAFIGCDLEGRVYEWNDASKQLFGFDLLEIFESPLVNLVIGPGDADSFVAQMSVSISTDRPVKFELPGSGREGQLAMLEWTIMPMRGMDGEVSSVVITAVDVTERVNQEARLRELAYRDALTGLFNRRAFLNGLHEHAKAVASDAPLSVILMDVDKFKVYNDTYGHPAGDALLRRIGDLLRDHCPDHAMAGRYGGEEFIVMLPGAGPESAFEVAETMRNAVESFTKDLHGATASFGVATMSDPAFPVADLIQHADVALYTSKHNGRNRTTLSTNQSDGLAA